jgi:hypothetical protein
LAIDAIQSILDHRQTLEVPLTPEKLHFLHIRTESAVCSVSLSEMEFFGESVEVLHPGEQTGPQADECLVAFLQFPASHLVLL